MSTIRIYYGAFGSPPTAKTIDFPYFAYRATPPDYPRFTLRNSSASGVVETLTVRADVAMELAVRNLLRRDPAHITLKRKIKQWEQWAQKGNSWALAMDNTNTVQTTLTDNVEVGDSIVPVEDASGIEEGREYVIRNDVDIEVVKVDTIFGLTLTLAEPLNTAFFSGDRFRAEMFFPARLVDSRPIIIERGPLFFDVEIRFQEDLSEL